jgi:hypothetical protein
MAPGNVRCSSSLCAEDVQEELVQEMVVLEKACQRIEHLGVMPTTVVEQVIERHLLAPAVLTCAEGGDASTDGGHVLADGEFDALNWLGATWRTPYQRPMVFFIIRSHYLHQGFLGSGTVIYASSLPLLEGHKADFN